MSETIEESDVQQCYSCGTLFVWDSGLDYERDRFHCPECRCNTCHDFQGVDYIHGDEEYRGQCNECGGPDLEPIL